MPNLPSDLNPEWWKQNKDKAFKSELGRMLESYWKGKQLWLDPTKRCRGFYETAQHAVDEIQKTARNDMARCTGPDGAETQAVLKKYVNLSAVARGQIDRFAKEYTALVERWSSIRTRLLEAMKSEEAKMETLLKNYENLIAMVLNDVVTEQQATIKKAVLEADEKKINSEVLKIFATAKNSGKVPYIDDVPPEAAGAWAEAVKIQSSYVKRRQVLEARLDEVVSELPVAK